MFSSNENTPLIGLKSENREDLLKELDRRSQKLYKSLASGNLSEEALQLRALEHVHIHKAMVDLYEMSLKKEEEPIEETITLIPDEPIDMKSIEQTQLEELNQFYMAFRK
jgi:hypothetical protein